MVYVSPAEASAAQVQAAVDTIDRPDGVLIVKVVEQTHHPEDWGGYNIVVYLKGYSADEHDTEFARQLAAKLGVEVLTEDELTSRLGTPKK